MLLLGERFHILIGKTIILQHVEVYLVQFNPPVNPELLFSLARNTLIHVPSTETLHIFITSSYMGNV
jgi:hypothetical protein